MQDASGDEGIDELGRLVCGDSEAPSQRGG